METRQGLSTREIAGDVEPDERATDDDAPRSAPATPRDEQPSMRDAEATTAPEQATPAADEPSRSSSTGELAAESPELLPHDENTGFQRRWEEIQTGFVDEPRRTVEQADELVAQVMQRLAEGFAAERERLEQQWGRGEDVSTEDLRIALQRYRGFFQRLLSA
jgi:hypothetical protein